MEPSGRSEGGHIEALRQLRNGIIGNVHTVKAIDHQHRKPIGRAPVESLPPGVDYDMWLGPAPKTGFTKNRWHYDWRWFWSMVMETLQMMGYTRLTLPYGQLATGIQKGRWSPVVNSTMMMIIKPPILKLLYLNMTIPRSYGRCGYEPLTIWKGMIMEMLLTELKVKWSLAVRVYLLQRGISKPK